MTNVKIGDIVETAGGTKSLAPQSIPIGTITAVTRRSGIRSPIVEVEPNATLDQLNFVSVVLFVPESGRDLSRAIAAVCALHPPHPGCLGGLGHPADGLRERIGSTAWPFRSCWLWLPRAGAGAGSERGAFAGFALGMMYDLGVGTPLGLHRPRLWPCRAHLRLRPQHHARPPVVAGGDLRGDRGGGGGSSDSRHQVSHRPGRVADRSDCSRSLPIVTVASTLLSPLFVPLGRWCVGASAARGGRSPNEAGAPTIQPLA